MEVNRWQDWYVLFSLPNQDDESGIECFEYGETTPTLCHNQLDLRKTSEMCFDHTHQAETSDAFRLFRSLSLAMTDHFRKRPQHTYRRGDVLYPHRASGRHATWADRISFYSTRLLTGVLGSGPWVENWLDTDCARPATKNLAMPQTTSRDHLFPVPRTIGPPGS